MQPGKTLRGRIGWWLAAVLLLGCLAAPCSAVAEASRSGAGDLSQRLAELAKPSIRDLPPAAQAHALSLAKDGPGSLLRQGNRVLAEVRVDGEIGPRVAALRSAGAAIVSVSPRYKTITVAVEPADLQAIAGVPGVTGAHEVLTPMTFAATGCPSGGTVSEGDIQLRAAEARSQFSVDGSGVTVGILSDSFDRNTTAATHATEDAVTGDLPGLGNPCSNIFPVNKVDDSETEGADEGRAMTQIVHDLAPGAKLAFATAFTGETAFAKNIERLAKPLPEGAGAQVIADDVAYFDEPFFQDGPVAVAASKVNAAGVDYFSAAGNDNLIDSKGRNIASWEAPGFRSAPSCPTAIATSGAADCMDFNPDPEQTDATFGITVEPKATLAVDLQWAEPWFGVTTDLDAYLLDSEGKLIKVGGSPIKSTEDNVGVTQEPFEFLQWENSASSSRQVQVVINRCSSGCNPAASATATPRLKLALLENGSGVSSIEYPTSVGGDVVGPTIFGHTGAAGVVSVGAVPYSSGATPERYSSRGPVTHYFGPVLGGAPAEPLEFPAVISKPDLAATDCGVTTFFAFQDETGKWRFCGTSAAAPHAAAVAALMLQKVGNASTGQIRSALSVSAAPVGAFSPCAVGAGLVDAVGAIEELVAPGAGTSPGICVPPVSDPFLAAAHETVTAPSSETSPTAPSPGVSPQAVDTSAPNTFIPKHPLSRILRTRRRKVQVVLGFASNEDRVTFTCRVDAGSFHPCAARFARRFRIGKHVVRVKARDAAGNLDPTPAIYRFRVEPIKP